MKSSTKLKKIHTAAFDEVRCRIATTLHTSAIGVARKAVAALVIRSQFGKSQNCVRMVDGGPPDENKWSGP